MWVASWLICVIMQSCEEVSDIKPKYFQTEQACEEYGKQKAISMSKYLTDKKIPNQVGYRCDKDNSIREINGS